MNKDSESLATKIIIMIIIRWLKNYGAAKKGN